MALTSLVFALFSIITITIYFIVPKKIQWVVLLVSSVIFLFYNNLTVGTVVQALIVLLSAYFCGRLVYKNKDKPKKSKAFLLLGILLILAQLIYLKYTNLFLATANHINNLLNIDYQFEFVQTNSLIGISYYSLIMIGYLVDIFRGASKPQNNIFKCALFMSYFPILSSGPFIRYEDRKEELFGKHKFSYQAMCSGLVRVLWGLFKILVISQRLAIFVDTVWTDLNTYSGLFVMIAILFFPIQLYTNFSGSIDVIMGISEIMGIKLPENFTVPFASRTMTEFWRNWHITLGAWLRDYIFYPLQKSDLMQRLNKRCKNTFGKKVGKKIPLYLSMLIMWICIGIWHGGAYTYIIGSGLLQFLYIFLENILGPTSKKINNKLGINTEVFSYKLYQTLRTYLLFAFSMIFFRAPSVSGAINAIKSGLMFNNFQTVLNKSVFKSMLTNAGLDKKNLIILAVALVVLFIVEKLSLKGETRKRLFKQNLIFRWIILYVLIFTIIIFGCYGEGYIATNFIYRGF